MSTDDLVEVPLSALVRIFLALRLADQNDANLRVARCEAAIQGLPMSVRNRVVIAAAEEMRARSG